MLFLLVDIGSSSSLLSRDVLGPMGKASRRGDLLRFFKKEANIQSKNSLLPMVVRVVEPPGAVVLGRACWTWFYQPDTGPTKST